jgi:hypothetical protein
MAEFLKAGEKVFVPRVLVGEDEEHLSAFYHGEVASVTEEPSFSIYLRDGKISGPLHPKFAHRSLRVLLLTIGDYATEHSLLKNLTNSIHSYFKLLLPDEELRSYSLRTIDELRYLWEQDKDLTSHVVILGHGSPSAIRFGLNDIDANTVLSSLTPGDQAKQILSVCCHTGSASFAESFSKKRRIVQSFIAPEHPVQGAIASQFCQTYFAEQFLRGLGSYDAWRSARKSTPGSNAFVFWSRGKRSN